MKNPEEERIELPLRVHPGMMILFLTGSALFHLAALYFGKIFVRIAVFWYILYGLDLLLLIVNSIGLRYSQDFGSGHFSKGDKISYRIKITGTDYMPVPRIVCIFKRVHTKGVQELPPEVFSLFPGGAREFSWNIHTSLKGIYTMGFEELALQGFTGVFLIKLPIWSRTFYIYPRLLEFEIPLGRHKAAGGAGRTMAGISGEYHTFSGLKDYREGEEIRNISWSRFLQTGSPYLKTFESRGSSIINICLDRRPLSRSFGCEDTVLEAALGLIRTAVYSGQRVITYGFPGWEGMEISGPDEFLRLYRSTLYLEFDLTGLPDTGISTEGSLYLVSGLPDLLLLEPRFWSSRSSAHLIVVTEGMNEKSRSRTEILMTDLKNGEIEISEIRSAGSLEEDFKCILSS